MKRLGRISYITAKSVLIFLAFTIDIKVKADVRVLSAIGKSEIEKAGDVSLPTKNKIFREPVQIETFRFSQLKVYFNSIFLGISESSLLELENTPVINFMHGRCFIQVASQLSLVDEKKTVSQWLKVQTPQIQISAGDAEFSLDVSNHVSKLAVFRGKIILTDRASGQNSTLEAGKTVTVEGLLARGEHAKTFPLPLSYVDALRDYRELSNLNPSEIQSRSDILRPQWQAVVESISDERQQAVEKDKERLRGIVEKQALAEEKTAKSNAELKRFFREKTLGTAH